MAEHAKRKEVNAINLANIIGEKSEQSTKMVILMNDKLHVCFNGKANFKCDRTLSQCSIHVGTFPISSFTNSINFKRFPSPSYDEPPLVFSTTTVKMIYAPFSKLRQDNPCDKITIHDMLLPLILVPTVNHIKTHLSLKLLKTSDSY
ncbi:unnamed protein product [Phytomonas sp. Hart1]|nr:unnamed protein product [Phytomonas sp. Hart1]|eukprot:CCW67354.1 unnamed protein product [Phytomonas sp. isolate Hart1]